MMTRLSTLACALAVTLVVFSLVSPACLSAAETTVNLKGRVDAAGLDVPAGGFTVRASRPQQRTVELGKTATDGSGNFQLAVSEEALALYGVELEATSATNASLVLEAALLRPREAGSPIIINLSSTVESAILNWRIQSQAKNTEANRPYRLFEWALPLSELKARDGLKRAQTVLAKWALAAAAPASQTTAAVLQSAVGDFRLLRKRLSDLRVPQNAIAQLEEMAHKDAEIAYVLMMPYFLDL